MGEQRNYVFWEVILIYKLGIVHLITCVDTTLLNGRAEWKSELFVELACILLLHYYISTSSPRRSSN